MNMEHTAVAQATLARGSRELRRMSVWDRAAIILLGAAGFAFSYDALRQVAIAIHARPSLSYLFPVFIDGFIAYGVRALVLLRHSGFGARMYAWFLFLAATGSSLWANALHAITLNRGPQSGSSALHLEDRVVGVLSTLAPLALAGSVHLYIIMARTAESSVPDRSEFRPQPVREAVRTERTSATEGRFERGWSGAAPASESVAVPGPSVADGRDQGSTDGQRASLDMGIPPASVHPRDAEGWPSASREHAEVLPDGRRRPAGPEGTSVPDGSPVPADRVDDQSPDHGTANPLADEDKIPVPDGGEASEDREIADDWKERLLPVAREAAQRAGKITRDAIKYAVRAREQVGNDRMGELLAALHEEAEAAQNHVPTTVSSVP
ncbi:DUF2637 domain-containing protein [Streptomyces sp. NPDC059002]|uniref:DUF2637 domain-containing protein n=1 Tax=Streptomyces sp. NPDC059002 TaxID=3346690 RepID=UPI003685CCA6